MTDELDELGPVDFLVVEFPAGLSNFTGGMAAELAALHESGTIRLLDLLVLRKNGDGSLDTYEIDDLDETSELVGLEAEVAEILSVEDVQHLSDSMEPGSTAGVVVWENSWAAAFATETRRVGGQLIAAGGIAIPAIVASFEAEAAAPTKAGRTALREARDTRRAVIGSPVARSRAAPGSTTIIADGVDRRQDLHAETRDDAGEPAPFGTTPDTKGK